MIDFKCRTEVRNFADVIHRAIWSAQATANAYRQPPHDRETRAKAVDYAKRAARVVSWRNNREGK